MEYQFLSTPVPEPQTIRTDKSFQLPGAVSWRQVRIPVWGSLFLSEWSHLWQGQRLSLSLHRHTSDRWSTISHFFLSFLLPICFSVVHRVDTSQVYYNLSRRFSWFELYREMPRLSTWIMWSSYRSVSMWARLPRWGMWSDLWGNYPLRPKLSLAFNRVAFKHITPFHICYYFLRGFIKIINYNGVI